MFLFASCCGVDPKKIGYQKNLMQTPHMFDHYFGSKFATGSNIELDFSYSILARRNFDSPYVREFKKSKMKNLHHNWKEMRDHFLHIKNTEYLPEEFKEKLLGIYRSELKGFAKMLPR